MTETAPAPPDALRARILGAVQAEHAPTRGEVRRRSARLLIVGFAVSLVLFWVVGGVRATGRPTGLIVATGIGTAVLAFVVAWLAFARGCAPVRRTRALLVGVALASPALLLGGKVWLSSLVPGMLAPMEGRVGFRCLALSLATGLCPLAAFVAARRGSDPVHPVALGAALGAGAGTFSASLVDLWCPVAHPPHLLLGHVLPLVLLTLAGAGLGTRTLRA